MFEDEDEVKTLRNRWRWQMIGLRRATTAVSGFGLFRRLVIDLNRFNSGTNVRMDSY